MHDLTILIPINQGIAYRYILQTDIFKEIQSKAKKIIILVPEPTDPFYENIKLYNNVIVEDYRQAACEKYMNSSKLHKRLKLIRDFVQNGKYDITTTKGHHDVYIDDFYNKTTPGYKRRFLLWVTNLIIFLARQSKILRKLILYLENVLFTPNIHNDLFIKYQPDSLVVTSMGTFDYDQFFMRQARKHGVKVISVILSWDNTTTRGYPAAYSDLIIAWTDIMKKELIQLNDSDENKIQVGGVALYDTYFNNEHLYSREELYTKLNINYESDIIFFATKSPNCYASNDYIAKIILEAINNKQLVNKCQLLVRLHPIYYRRNNGDLIFSRFIDDFNSLQVNYERLTINKPTIMSTKLNYSMPDDEIKLLASILKHSSLIINVFSSLNIEASIFDIPIINVSFEGTIHDDIKKARYNINQDMNESHNVRIVNSGGVAMLYQETDLIPFVNEALSDPSKRKYGRQNILKKETGPHNGYAGKRIAEMIFDI